MTLTLSPKQADFISNATHSFNIASGPTRTGKTLASLMRWYEYIYSPEVSNGSSLLMSGRTGQSLYQNCIRELLNLDQGNYDLEWSSSKSRLFVRSRGIEIRAVGCDTENTMERIRGMTSAGYYCDEACAHKESFVDMAVSRCTTGNARLKIFTTNPDSPMHWFKTRYMDSRDLDVGNWYFGFEDNPSLTPAVIDELNRAFVGVFHDRMIKGLWTIAEGAIFDKFNRTEHVIRESEVPLKSIDRYVLGIDWGYGDGHDLALDLIAVENDQTCYVVDELVRSKQLIDQSLVNLMATKGWFDLPLAEWNGTVYGTRRTRPITAYVDSSRPEYVKLFKDLTGIPTVGAVKTSKIELIQSVQRRLIKNSKGKYGIYFVEGRTQKTLQQIDSYRWKPGLEEPVKEFDDCVDAIQYAVSMLRRRLDFGSLGKIRSQPKELVFSA